MKPPQHCSPTCLPRYVDGAGWHVDTTAVDGPASEASLAMQLYQGCEIMPATRRILRAQRAWQALRILHQVRSSVPNWVLSRNRVSHLTLAVIRTWQFSWRWLVEREILRKPLVKVGGQWAMPGSHEACCRCPVWPQVEQRLKIAGAVVLPTECQEDQD